MSTVGKVLGPVDSGGGPKEGTVRGPWVGWGVGVGVNKRSIPTT